MRGKAIVKMVFAAATALLLTILLGFLLRLYADGKLEDKLNLGWFAVHSFNDRDYHIGGGEFDDIHTLEINWIGGAVELCAYDGDTLSISEPKMADTDDQLRWRMENGTLVIQTCKPGLGNARAERLNKTLSIQVPETWNLRLAEIDSASADVRVSGLTLAALEVDLAAGDLTLERSTVTALELSAANGGCTATDTTIQNLDMDVANGDVYVRGAVSYLDIDAAAVKLTLVTGVVPRSISMDMTAGSADITLPADAGFTADCDRIAGNLRIEGFDTVQRNEGIVCGDGSAEYSFDCISGDIVLRAAS